MADRMVLIGIDNMAAISATLAIKPSPSHYIWDMFHQRVAMACKKHKGMDLLVKWTPGHMDIIGNKKADKEVKKAVREGSSPLSKLPAPLRKMLPWSKSAAKQEYTRKLKVAASELWKGSPRYERMEWIDLDFKHNAFIKLIHKVHQEHASLLFQLRMGHVPLNTYLHKIQKIDSPICSECHQHSKMVIHFILHTLILIHKRHRKIQTLQQKSEYVTM